MASPLSANLSGQPSQFLKQLEDNVAQRVAVPASASAAGTVGQYAVTSGFAYFCVATNTWERVAIATW